MNNTCVCCGAMIPEGSQVCKACEKGFIAQNQETLSKIGDIVTQIGNVMLESVETAIEAMKELFSQFFDDFNDLVRRLAEMIVQDIEPKTIPPRSPVRCIGCRPETGDQKPKADNHPQRMPTQVRRKKWKLLRITMQK